MAKQIYKVPSQLTPDVWLKPVHIWEVQADSFTVSKVHQAGRAALLANADIKGGLSLRFPRFVRTRPDKQFKITIQEFLDYAQATDIDDTTADDDQMEVGTSTQEIVWMYLGGEPKK